MQEDPHFFLLIIVMEIQSRIANVDIGGDHWGLVSHILYPDDILVLCKIDPDNCDIAIMFSIALISFPVQQWTWTELG